MKQLKTANDLKPAKYNPRSIQEESAAGLAASLKRFGDISGIVWNQKTGNLVCGHQRVEQLKEAGAVMVAGKNPKFVLKQGKKTYQFPIRVVELSRSEEVAANVAANNHQTQGEFTDNLSDLLAEIEGSLGPEVFDELNLDALAEAEKLANDAPKQKSKEKVCPHCGCVI